MNTLAESKNAAPTKTVSLGWLAAWAVASGIGLVIGVMGSLRVIWNLGENGVTAIPVQLQPILGGAFLGLAIGLATGLAQWLVLRARGINNPRWLMSSIFGGGVGGVVAGGILFGLNNSGDNPGIILAAFAVLGAVLGGAQLVMAREITGNAGWIVASALGIGGSAAIFFGAPNADINPVIGGVGGLVYGILTAAALWWGAHK